MASFWKTHPAIERAHMMPNTCAAFDYFVSKVFQNGFILQILYYNIPTVMIDTALLISESGAMADTTAIPALWKQPIPRPMSTVYP
jgi:hypothetical protein